MKVELRVVNGGGAREACPENHSSYQESADEAAIDIAQVLAANQALLKNVCRRMESMEVRLTGLQSLLNQQNHRLALENEQKLMLAAPSKIVQPWHPVAPALDESWYSRFTFWTRWFNPARMRRPDIME
ncbi:MAG: hypothetical protein HQM09_10090 [Candidatus Riflebacteria bacterium]|nr:hypothetical protein [Candidatus Riflebacteria bacterium]